VRDPLNRQPHQTEANDPEHGAGEAIVRCADEPEDQRDKRGQQPQGRQTDLPPGQARSAECRRAQQPADQGQVQRAEHRGRDRCEPGPQPCPVVQHHTPVQIPLTGPTAHPVGLAKRQRGGHPPGHGKGAQRARVGWIATEDHAARHPDPAHQQRTGEGRGKERQPGGPPRPLAPERHTEAYNEGDDGKGDKTELDRYANAGEQRKRKAQIGVLAWRQGARLEQQHEAQPGKDQAKDEDGQIGGEPVQVEQRRQFGRATLETADQIEGWSHRQAVPEGEAGQASACGQSGDRGHALGQQREEQQAIGGVHRPCGKRHLVNQGAVEEIRAVEGQPAVKITQARHDRVVAVPLHSLQIVETKVEELRRTGAAIGHPEQRGDQQDHQNGRTTNSLAGQAGQWPRRKQQPGSADDERQDQGHPVHRQRQVPDLQQCNDGGPAGPEGDAEPEEIKRPGAEQPAQQQAHAEAGQAQDEPGQRDAEDGYHVGV